MKKIFVLLVVSLMCSAMVAMESSEPEQGKWNAGIYACVDAQYSGNNLRALTRAIKNREDMIPLAACFSSEEPDMRMIDGTGEGYLSECPVGQQIPFQGNLRCLNDHDCVINKNKGVAIADTNGVVSFSDASTVVAQGDYLVIVANDGSLYPFGVQEKDVLGHGAAKLGCYAKRSAYGIVDSSYVSPTGLLPMRFRLGGASFPQAHVGLYDVMQQTLVRLIDFKRIHKESTRILARPCDQTMVVVSNENFSHCAELYDPRTGALEKSIAVRVGSSSHREHLGRVVRDPDWLVPARNLNTLVAVCGNRTLCQCDWRQEKLQALWSVGGEGFYESGAISDDGTKVAVVLEDSTRETYQSRLHEITGLADVGANVTQPEYKERCNFKVQFSNRDAQPEDDLEDDLNEQALDLVGEDLVPANEQSALFGGWLRWLGQ